MSAGFRLYDFLKKKGVHFDSIMHPKRDTAFDTAVIENIPPHAFAKVVMVKVKGKDAMFVIPANRRLDFFKVADELGTSEVRIEKENDFQEIFTDSEKGAMPPFAILYGVPAYLDVELENQNEVYFNAGSHREILRMAMKDYLPLAEAEIGDYSVPRDLNEKIPEGQVRCG